MGSVKKKQKNIPIIIIGMFPLCIHVYIIYFAVFGDAGYFNGDLGLFGGVFTDVFTLFCSGLDRGDITALADVLGLICKPKRLGSGKLPETGKPSGNGKPPGNGKLPKSPTLLGDGKPPGIGKLIFIGNLPDSPNGWLKPRTGDTGTIVDGMET